MMMGERAARVEMEYNYILGQWELGRKPFVSFREQEILKMETTPSIQRPFLEQTAEFTAWDVAAVRINGSILIDTLVRTAVGTTGSVAYTVRRSQTAAVERAELLDKSGKVLTSNTLYVPLLEDEVTLRHSFLIREAGNGETDLPAGFSIDPSNGCLYMEFEEEPYDGPGFQLNGPDLEVFECR